MPQSQIANSRLPCNTWAKSLGVEGIADLWLKNHGAAEKELSDELTTVLRSVGTEVVAKYRAAGHTSIDWQDASKRILDTLRSKAEDAVALGATTEWLLHIPKGKPKSVKGAGGMLEVPDIRQHDHFSCGAAASMCVGRYFGVGPDTLEEWKAALGTNVEESTRPTAIVEYMKSLGLTVEAKDGMSIDDLRTAWEAGSPVICPVQDYGPFVSGKAKFDYGHYLTVVYVLPDGIVMCQDSSQDNSLQPNTGTIAMKGRITVEPDVWVKNWHDKDIDGNLYQQYGIVVSGPATKGFTTKEKHPKWEELPKDVQESVKKYADKFMEQPYLRDITTNLREAIEAKVKQGILDGDPTDEIAEDLETMLGEDGSRARANNIARTETTGLMNAGHNTVDQKLQAMGVIDGREWLGILDDSIRPDHDEATGQRRAADEPFEVGGELGMFPGDYAFSAEERCGCRCTTVTYKEEVKEGEEDETEKAWIREWISRLQAMPHLSDEDKKYNVDLWEGILAAKVFCPTGIREGAEVVSTED